MADEVTSYMLNEAMGKWVASAGGWRVLGEMVNKVMGDWVAA